MTQEQFERACETTLDLMWKRLGNQRQEPERDPEVPYSPRHCAWMLAQAADFHRAGRTDKANRWLGYVQGVLAAVGVDLEALKRANMPDGAEFDGDRV